MLEITTNIQLDNFVRNHPKAFVVFTRRGSPVHSEIDSFTKQLQDANTSVDIAECFTDLLTPIGYASSVRIVPSFVAYRDGVQEKLVEGLAVKRAAAACEALEFVD